MVGVCETTGDVIPESVVHLWGAADAAARDTSADAVVVLNRLSELGGAPYDGNLAYDDAHTPRRPEQILSRVLVSLGEKKTYETRFGSYHVLGNNCEHFATWCRYGVNRSDQIGDAVKFIGAGLGAVGLGAPGALIGGYAANELIRSTYKTRLDETARSEFLLFENTDGCEFADDDAETDWVVERLIASTEEFEWREKSRARRARQRASALAERRSGFGPNARGTHDIEHGDARVRSRPAARDAERKANRRRRANDGGVLRGLFGKRGGFARGGPARVRGGVAGGDARRRRGGDTDGTREPGGEIRR